MVYVKVFGTRLVLKQLTAARFKKGWTVAHSSVREVPTPNQEKIRAMFAAIAHATANVPLSQRLRAIRETLKGTRLSEKPEIERVSIEAKRSEVTRAVTIISGVQAGTISPSEVFEQIRKSKVTVTA